MYFVLYHLLVYILFCRAIWSIYKVQQRLHPSHHVPQWSRPHLPKLKVKEACDVSLLRARCSKLSSLRFVIYIIVQLVPLPYTSILFENLFYLKTILFEPSTYFCLSFTYPYCKATPLQYTSAAKRLTSPQCYIRTTI